jgi:DNA-directed RNA polymerase specialized sigma24 family protein
LNELLRGEYDEQRAEQVLQHYLRFLHAQIEELVRSGLEYSDVEQELRIALWRAWCSYRPCSSRVSLRMWVSYKLNYKLRDLRRRYRRMEYVPI